jgi:UDP-N-acetylglucosamine 2-epimerase (non-hydrolysing)
MTWAYSLGSRPESIKMAPVIREGQRRGLNISIIPAGQHYSYQMDRIFFEQLELPQPDHNLDVGSGNHGEQTGRILADLEGVLMAKRPDIAPFEQPLQGCNAGNRGWPLIG